MVEVCYRANGISFDRKGDFRTVDAFAPPAIGEEVLFYFDDTHAKDPVPYRVGRVRRVVSENGERYIAELEPKRNGNGGK